MNQNSPNNLLMDECDSIAIMSKFNVLLYPIYRAQLGQLNEKNKQIYESPSYEVMCACSNKMDNVDEACAGDNTYTLVTDLGQCPVYATPEIVSKSGGRRDEEEEEEGIYENATHYDL